MKTTTFKNNWLTAAAVMLTLPTGYFILIALLKYGLGINGPFDAIEPSLIRWGIQNSIGWNINLLILLGPVLAFLLTVFQVLKIEFRISKQVFLLNLSVQKNWLPLMTALFSAGVLAILFFYALGENCNC